MEFAPEVMFHVFGLPITETVTTTWLIMAVLILIAWKAGRNLKKIPEKSQIVTEILVDAIVNLTKSTMGEKHVKFAPYVGTILLYISFANLIGLLGFRPPTADLNTTFALSLITFVLIHYMGLSTQKGGYIKGFVEPYAFLLPINILGELATPVSLAFRLFGSIMGGMIIMSLVYSFVPLIIPSVLHAYFDLFSGLLQSFIFVMLTMINISSASD